MQYRYAGVSITPNYESHTLEFAVSDLHFATVHGLRTDLGGCKIPKFSGGMPPDPAISFCTWRRSSYKRSVPMLCPSNGDVLARPLLSRWQVYACRKQELHTLTGY